MNVLINNFPNPITVCYFLAPVTFAVVEPDKENPTTLLSRKLSPPMITVPPANTTAELGENVTLTCGATGNPKPKIR